MVEKSKKYDGGWEAEEDKSQRYTVPEESHVILITRAVGAADIDQRWNCGAENELDRFCDGTWRPIQEQLEAGKEENIGWRASWKVFHYLKSSSVPFEQ